MKRNPGHLYLWTLAAVMAMATPAWAVIPGLTGPLQAIGQILPQILPFLAAGIAGFLGIPAWRERLRRVGRWIVTPRGLVTACTIGVIAASGVYYVVTADRSLIADPGPALEGADWPMFRSNLKRTGAAGEGPTKADVLWTFSDPDIQLADYSSSPAVVGDRIFVASAQASVFESTGMVYCLDARTGKRIWQFQMEKQGFSSPSVADGRVYVGEGLHTDADCKVYCLDAATGRRLWAARTRSHTESSPAIAGGKVYIGAGEDGVYCLDAKDGKTLWHRAGIHVDTSPAVADGKVYLGIGYGKTGALALDAATGKTIWETPCDLPVWGEPAIVDGKAYFGIGNGNFVTSHALPMGGVWRLDAASGKEDWRRPMADTVVGAVLVQGDRVYTGCRDGKVYALSAATGEFIWSAKCGGPVVASPAADQDRLYVAGGRGVQALDLRTGQLAWSIDLAAQTAPDVNLYSSPALAAGRLYVGTSSEKLFCIGK